MKHTTMNRPEAVATAAILLYLSAGIDALISMIMSNPGRLGIMCIMLISIHMVWKGKNWARVALLVWCVIGFSIFVGFIINLPVRISLFDLLPNIIQAMMQGVALVLLFQKTSSDWFKQVNENRISGHEHIAKDYFPGKEGDLYLKPKDQMHSTKRDEWEQFLRGEHEEARQRVEIARAQRKAEEEQARQRAEEERARREHEAELLRQKFQKFFDILELPCSASFDDVKNKYRIMIRLFHPDKHSSDNILKEYADKKTKEVNNAFQTLKVELFKM